jgi:cbb3-type cytochrome oxidase subunit 3
MFLAADQAHRDVGLAFMSLCVIGMGAFFILTPAEHLLKSDQRMARWLYKAELKATGNEKRAVAAAAAFYKLFGGTLVFFGTVVLVLVFIVRG